MDAAGLTPARPPLVEVLLEREKISAEQVSRLDHVRSQKSISVEEVLVEIGGLEPKEIDDSSRIVIIEAENKQVVRILVDSVSEVVDLRSSEMEAAPNVGTEESAQFIQGVASVGGDLLILVDLNKLLSDEEWMEVASL